MASRLTPLRGRLADAGADSSEADGKAGADGGERGDPHGAILRKSRRGIVRVGEGEGGMKRERESESESEREGER